MSTEAFIQVNIPASLGKKLKSYETVDGNGDVVQVQTLTPVSPDGVALVLATEATQLDILAAILAQSPTSGIFTGINGDVVAIAAAMPIAQPGATLLRAGANAIGLVVVGGDLTMPVRALAGGPLSLAPAVWNAVTGGAGGLMPGARYYLSATLGQITTTAPIIPGQYVTVLGSAISDATMLIHPEPPILL